MEAKKEIKSQITKISILVIAVVTLGISLTYAYYTGNLSGEASIDRKSAAKLDVTSTLTTANAINNTKMTLIDAKDIETKSNALTFSVTNANTSTISGKYFIYLTDLKLTKNLYSTYFKWELLRVTSNGNSRIAIGSFADAIRNGNPVAGEAENVLTNVNDLPINKVALVIPKNTTDNLIFRIWLENNPDTNQISLTNGSFQGKLKLEASPE